MYSGSNLTVADSIINNNIAGTYGGGICSRYGTLTVSGCDFAYNIANSGGNAIYNYNGDTSNRVVHFNRFYDPASGYEIYSDTGSVDAMYNWWGSNDDPSSKVYGTVTTTPWLVLNVSASPSLIGKNVTSTITANLCYDSNGTYHDPNSGYITDGIPVIFTTTLGSITSPVSTVSGVANATLTGGSTSGVANIYALLDDQIIQNSVTIETTPPTVKSFDPKNSAVNVAANKIITVTFNEAIKEGSNFWIELKNSSGTAVSIAKSINGKVLTITPASNLTESLYTLYIHTGAVTDLAGNPVALTTSKFSVGSSPTITSTNPTNGATKVARNKTITITFNENIKPGSNYSKITLKASNGTTITITKSISGKVLNITHSSKLAANTKYTLTIYSGSVTDTAGNPVATKTVTFTTGSS